MKKVYLVFGRAAQYMLSPCLPFQVLSQLVVLQSADTTGVSSPLEQSTVGGSSTATDDKGETTKGTEKYKNINIEKYRSNSQGIGM